MYKPKNIFHCVLAADIQRERDDRIRAESKAANQERQVNVLQLDLKNLNQKLTRLEQDYMASQAKVEKLFLKIFLSEMT